jgi:hypothetical protein
MESLSGIPLMCYIPGAWVPHFINDTWNPPAALAWIASELSQWPADDRGEMMPMLNWLRLACMKRGRANTPGAALTSTLAMDWKVILADREYLKWSKRRLDSVLGPAAPAPMAPSPSPLTTTPTPMNVDQTKAASPMNAVNLQDQFFERLASSFLHLQNKSSAVSTKTDTTTPKGFSATERVRMLGWCGLTEATADQIPSIWTDIHAETSKNGKKAVLVTAFDPATTDDHDIDIHVDQKLTDDIVGYNFGYGMGNDYQQCHHGISPFAVAVYSRREKSTFDMLDQQTESATTRTMSDVKAHRRNPPKSPNVVDELLQWLKNYICFLGTLFGGLSPHLKQVKRITATVRSNKRVMATHMNRDMIAQILWAIFGDARQFFSKCATTRDFSDPDNLPQSHLQAVHSILASRVRLVLMDVPSELLAHPARDKGTASSGGGSGGGGNAAGGRQTQGNNRRQPDNNRNDRERADPAHDVAYQKWPDKFKTLLADLRDEPFLNLRQVCTDSNTTIASIKRPGGPNDCVRFFLWGRCNTARCTLEHPQIVLEDEYISMVCDTLKPGIDRMAQGKQSRKRRHGV